MIILSLDTSTRAGSAAVLRDGIVLREMAGTESLTHGQRLPDELRLLLDGTEIRIEDVDTFAVVAGPGSFTGLRVGIATMQGLAMAWGRTVTPVSSLEALARSAADGVHPIGTWMDAQRGEIFASLWAGDGRDVLVEPLAASPDETLERFRAAADIGAVQFIGDGAVRYRDAIAAVSPHAIVRAPAPLAAIVGRIAAEDPSRAVLPHAVVPVYLRRTAAELARDRRRAGG